MFAFLFSDASKREPNSLTAGAAFAVLLLVLATGIHFFYATLLECLLKAGT